jgi:hypothetical protein
MTIRDTVLTPLIVLSFTKEGIDNAIGAGNFKSIVGSDDVSIFNNHSNNFTKMTHSLGVGGKDSAFSIQLDLIDPVAEFEKRFVSLNITELLSSDLYEQDGAVDSEAEQKMIDVEKSNIQGGGPVQKIIEAASNRRVWITYGVGDDLNDWAGPFELTCTIAKLKIDTNNIKKLSLVFFPHDDSMTAPHSTTGGARNVDLAGIKNTAVGTVGPFEIGKGKPVGSEQYGGNGFVGNWFRFAEKAGVDTKDLNVFFQHFDVHATLMSCLRTMVRKATNCNNVVALMPNINTFGIKAIAQAVICKRGTAVTPDENKHAWLLDAANKCFAKFGASILVDDISQFVSGDPKDSTIVETNYAKYLDYFKSCEDTIERYVEKAKYTIRMQSITEASTGHYDGIKDKIGLIKQAIMQNYPTCHIKFVAESRSDITSNFQGSPGVRGPGPIIFFGDSALIQNVVYGNGDKAYQYLHPADKKLAGKGKSPKITEIPEFRMNVKDPNILNIELDTDKLYMQTLNAGFQSNASSKITNVAGVLSKAGEPGADADIGEITKALAATGSVSNSDVINMLISAEKALTKTDAKTTYEMDSTTNNNPAGVLAATYEMMYKLAVNMTITTLPHFHLSDPSVLGMQVMVNAMSPQAVVPGSGAVSQNLENAFFSGAYVINGFQHEISSNGIAKSKFLLVKIVTE